MFGKILICAALVSCLHAAEKKAVEKAPAPQPPCPSSACPNTVPAPTNRAAPEWNHPGGDLCPCLPCPPRQGGHTTFDSLWWRAENHGFSFAYDVHSESVNQGQIIRVFPNWDPGFRLGSGWNIPYDSWDLFLTWTWYANRARETRVRSDIATEISNQGLIPLWPVSEGGPYQAAVATWRMLFNTFDLELGKVFGWADTLTLRPHWGFRGVTIAQHFTDGFEVPLQIDINTEQKLSAHNNWWGFGPRVGFDANWRLGLGFSALGRASVSLPFGQTRVRFHTKEQPAGSSKFVTDRRIQEHFYQLGPNLQMFFGLDWSHCFYCNRFMFGLNMGWETSYWWNQFNLPVVLSGIIAPLPSFGSQPIGIEGITINFHFDY